MTLSASQPGNATYSPATTVSQSFTVTKSSQSISFVSIPDHTDSDAPFQIYASASSFLPVSYAVVSGPASVSGDIVTLGGTGTVTLRASQAGDTRYLAAPTEDQTFNVQLGPNGHVLTVIGGTADRIGGNYGAYVAISATPQSGKYFAGWAKDSGTGSISNVTTQNSNFIMGSTGATVRATWVATPLNYAITWNGINLPETVTAGDNQDGSTVMRFAALVTNTGTAPWSPTMGVSVYNAAGNIVGYAQPLSPGGVISGETTQLWFSVWLPTTPQTLYMHTLGAAATLFGTNVFSSRWALSNILARNGACPGFPSTGGVFIRSATVGVAMTIDLNASNSTTGYSLQGGLPPGVTFNTSSGQFSGTPTQAGKYALTVSATNSAGIGTAAVLITVYPADNYNLNVTDGAGSTSNLVVGSTTPISANPAPADSIFNGWTVTSGPGIVAHSHLATTVVRLDQPGDTVVKANYITGIPVTVVRGISSPLGGVPGATIALTPDPDGDGTMFSNWSTSGPGTIANATSRTTNFILGATGTTVTANFVPGYRLTMVGSAASAPGGVPGTEIAIWPTSPGPQYEFMGWWINGPGYLVGSTVIMGNGPAVVNTGWWPTSGGPLPRTYLMSNKYAVMKNEAFTLSLATTYSGTLTCQQLDYSTDNGLTWVLGTPAQGTRWDTPSSSDSWSWWASKSISFATAGTVVFRAKAAAGSLQNPVYAYVRLTVMNQSSATITTHPGSQTVAGGQGAFFKVVAEGTGGILYQWRKDGVAISGATNATYSIDHTLFSDRGNYSVAVWNNDNVVVSNAATLTVTGLPPSILVQPVARLVPPGLAVAFSVVPGGIGPFTYQWQRNGTAIAGATGGSYIIDNPQSGDGGSYRVAVSNTMGMTLSDSVALVVAMSSAAPLVTSGLTSSGVRGTAYSYTITGTHNPTSYGATNLPGGLSLNTSTGVISGTPTVVGVFYVALTAINDVDTSPVATLALSIANAVETDSAEQNQLKIHLPASL